MNLAGVGARFIIVAAILGAGFVFGSGLIAARLGEVRQDADPLPVQVVEAQEQETFIAARKFAGRIVPQRSSDVSFELGGKIIGLLVDDGDQVTEGEPLAQIDTEQLLNRRDELRAQKVEVEAQLRRAEATLQRTEELVKNGFSSQQALDNIQAERDGARARLRQVDAALASVETDLGNATINAPFAGQVVRRYVDEGAVVQPGVPVVRVNELGVLEARIGIPTTFRNKVTVGERYRVSAGPLVGGATVMSVVSDVNTQTGTLTIILEINDDPGFVARDLVRLSLDEEIRETGMWVPATALNESLRGLWAVFIAKPEGDGDHALVERKDVEVVHIEEERVYVRGTLEHGDLVIASGAFRFVPGQRVKIIRAE